MEMLKQTPAELDAADDLRLLREEFRIPGLNAAVGPETSKSPTAEESSRKAIYLCGNSLGLQPKETQRLVLEELQVWANAGVYGHHLHPKSRPWVDIDSTVTEEIAKIVGALHSEVAVMGTLTSNLHFLMAAFYKPTASRYKIILEDKAFPSDHYAVESQARWHGFSSDDALISVSPRPGCYTLDTDDILKVIEDNSGSTALILLPGVQYYTGQLFEMDKITKFAKERGIVVGWDLAHAVGNVELSLHEWNVDFAVWCSYKYLNSGPGGIGGIFVHEDRSRQGRLTGWWGHEKATRFAMENDFSAIPGAAGFQHSNPSVLATVCLLGSLKVFARTSMKVLRAKSIRLTSYMEQLLLSDPETSSYFEIITPRNLSERGAQLSLLFKNGIMEAVHKRLELSSIVVDKRQPDVIRVAPAPLYNTFEEVFNFSVKLQEAIIAAVTENGSRLLD
ncbi:Kynureninase [Orbilia brochopaga]|nr:Kynureninase [Drechslerella brochopaga]